MTDHKPDWKSIALAFCVIELIVIGIMAIEIHKVTLRAEIAGSKAAKLEDEADRQYIENWIKERKQHQQAVVESRPRTKR